MEGSENLCIEGYQGTYLGQAASIWGNAGFAIKIPVDLPAEIACPLICGGGTVFEAVADYVKVGSRVAVASIGGLGTAAIRFAKLYGAHVTALSRGDTKKDKCLKIGADAYEGCLGNEEKMGALASKFDLIIDTSPANSDIGPYMGMLKINGTYCRVGIPPGNDMEFKYGYIPLIFTQKKIAGSIVTGTKRMKLMLELTNDHKDIFENPDEWKTEVVPFDQVNECMTKLSSGQNDSMFRYLLKW